MIFMSGEVGLHPGLYIGEAISQNGRGNCGDGFGDGNVDLDETVSMYDISEWMQDAEDEQERTKPRLGCSE